MEKTDFPSPPVWAWHPDRREHEAGYTLFRRTVECRESVPYHIIVSADNRFTFFLDGAVLGRGPLRGDLDHYFYDEYRGVLPPGKHIFAAEVIVWRPGWRSSSAPWSEIHAGGGFMAAGLAGDERLELPGKWLCSIDSGRTPLEWDRAWSRPYVPPAPPPDEVDFSRHDPNWNTAERPRGEWVAPRVLGRAVFRDDYQFDPETPWNLQKRPLPQMEHTFSPVAEILSGPGTLKLADGKLVGDIPAGKYRILLDLGKNQTVFVRLSAASGNGSCRIAYGETLFDEAGGKVRSFPGTLGGLGYGDLLHLARSPWRYASFWYRTARFIEIATDSTAGIAGVELELEFVSFPFGKFRDLRFPGDPMAEKIFDIGCHTLRCCAHEHFEDCPYYEQLQYVGDARIEALLSYELSGGDALGRHALKTFAASMLENGLIRSRHPSTFRQVIPGYALIWVLMLRDHWEHFHDRELVRELLPKAETMLDACERAREGNGLVGPLPGWHFTDWTKMWPMGAADRGENAPDTILNLFYALACESCAVLQEATGGSGKLRRERRDATIEAVNAHCYDPARRRYFDVPGHPEYLSMHANIMALLAGAVPEPERPRFLREICADADLAPVSLYFSFYLFSAVRRCGTYEQFRALLGPWERAVEAGCTTFPETGNLRKTRSDCHAWSASPLLFLISWQHSQGGAE